MNNRFGDSRQRFSIRKFTVGVASVLLSSAVFGVSTAKADQAEEPKGQPATRCGWHAGVPGGTCT